jgi:hypothetical protein
MWVKFPEVPCCTSVTTGRPGTDLAQGVLRARCSCSSGKSLALFGDRGSTSRSGWSVLATSGWRERKSMTRILIARRCRPGLFEKTPTSARRATAAENISNGSSGPLGKTNTLREATKRTGSLGDPISKQSSLSWPFSFECRECLPITSIRQRPALKFACGLTSSWPERFRA